MDSLGVSVIVIAYNEEEKIAECIRSILDVDYSPVEIIIVDASTDRTPLVVGEIKDSRIRHSQTTDRGYSLQRNIGVNLAKFPLVAFTDADCRVPRNWLSLLIPVISGSVVGAGGNAFPPSDTNGFGLWVAALGFPGGGALGADANMLSKEKFCPATCNAIFRKDAILNAGGFDESLVFGGEDTRLGKEIRRLSYDLKYVPNSFVIHCARSRFKDFFFWSITRGRAKAQLARNQFLHRAWNGVILISVSILTVYGLFIAYHMPIEVFLILVISIVFGNFLLFNKTRKFKLAWVRRRSIGLSRKELLICVPTLFIVRRLLMAVGALLKPHVDLARKV
jgi:glycosyltransferase involved in cell wall biosynthesis